MCYNLRVMRYLLALTLLLLMLSADKPDHQAMYCGEASFTNPIKHLDIHLLEVGDDRYLELCTEDSCQRIILKVDTGEE